MKIFAVLSVLLASVVHADVPPTIDLSQFPPDSVWRTANSKTTSRKDADGTLVWRWEIAGGEGFLWLNEQLPIHKDLPQYQRLMYDVNFAEGQINQFWPRTMGVLPPPYEKMFCEWNLFYFTHPHKQWIRYQQILNDPTWFAFYASQIPEEVKFDKSRFMGFACLGKGQSTVVELRNVRLVRDSIRVEKPYLTTPIGWPVAETLVGAKPEPVRYRTPYFVKNVSEKAAKVEAVLQSQHRSFQISIDPARADIPPGQTRRFDVLATPADNLPPMTEETAVVNFVPDGNDSLAYRTETFCTAPLPKDVHRMVMYTPAELAAMKAKPVVDSDAQFWMGVKLEGQTEIPNGVGHMVVFGVPATCEKCKKGQLQITQNWLEVKCNNCGYTEHHTRTADATWIQSWSAIHGNGPNPTSLGRAYLATGDEKYAKQAIALLTLLSTKYGQLTWHNANGPEGWNKAEPASPEAYTNGASARWGNAPSYGTNFMVQGLAMMHNMICDSPAWTEAQRTSVHEGFWIPVATELMKITPGISNMNDIINRDLILAGLSCGDANMLYRGTMHPMGLVARMHDINPDGFSDEGSAMNYHLAAMNEWLPSMKLLLSTGLKFGDIEERAAAAMKMPILRADLGGLAYSTGNSGTPYYQVPLDHPNFLIADQIFPESIWPRKRAYSTEPTLFRDAGWAILRSGKTRDEQVVVNLDFGRSHGHGDLDRMNLGLQAFGAPLAADPGSSYNYNNDAPWGPAAASMDSPFVSNTIIVDGQPQIPGTGTLVKWEPAADKQTVAAEISGIYPGVHWRRSVTLIGGVVVIIDDIDSAKSHRYELAWHHLLTGAPAGSCKTSELSQSLGDGRYKNLLKPQKIVGEPVEMQWTNGSVHVHLWQPPEKDQLVYTAQTGVCWDNVKGLPIDGLYTRRQGNATRFVTVLEPYKSQRVLREISAGDQAVSLTFADGSKRQVESK